MAVRAVNVPMRRPLGTSAQTIRTAPLLLIDLRTVEGVVGRAYLFCYDSLGQRLMRDVLADVASLIPGLALDVDAVGALVDRRCRLLGARGVVGMALAGLDVALWDALAQSAGLSLSRYLRAEPVPIPSYNSNGLGLIGAGAVGAEAVELVEEGYRAVKLRLGYPTLAEDLNAVRAVRDAIGPEVEIVVDYNQLLTTDEAARRCAAIDAQGLGWIEEPIVHDDFASCAVLAKTLSTPIQLGENFLGPHAVRQALDSHACDLMMFDLQRIGGVSGWRAAATIAAAAGVPVSSHLFPEVSVHLLAATPTRDRLEMVDWANPILEEPLAVREGMVAPHEAAGTGVRWNEDAVTRYLV